MPDSFESDIFLLTYITLYKSHQIGRVLRYNLKFAGNPRFASWKSWRKSV